MNENRVYPLYLRHCDIQTTTTTQTVDNANGGWSAYKQTTYWYVNMKTLLGSSWDKYSVFSIGLKSVINANVAYPTSATTDVNWNSFISGLNWCETSYNPVTKNQSNRAFLFSAVIPTSSNNITYFNLPANNLFYKGDALVKIQVEHFRTVDGLPVSSTVGLPHSVFVFDIKGVELNE